MPVYNSGSYLDISVKSILSQSFSNFELILVDDGSSDGSSDRCDYWSEQDHRVVVLHQKNGGICAARNSALKIAKGEYIGFSDHDDEYGENQLSDNIAIIEKNNADVVIFGYNTIFFNGSNIVKKETTRFPKIDYDLAFLKKNFWEMFRANTFDCVWNCLFRKSFLLKNGICFDTFYKAGGEDYDFLWHCVGCSPILSVNDGVYYNHYIRNGFSTSTRYNPNSVDVALTRAEHLVPYVENFIDVNLCSSDYFSFWIQRVLGDLCHFLAHPKNPLKSDEKKQLVSRLKESKYLCHSTLKCENVKLRYKVLWILFKLDRYGSCIGLYQLLNKKRGIR